jgi:hypothetical protein
MRHNFAHFDNDFFKDDYSFFGKTDLFQNFEKSFDNHFDMGKRGGYDDFLAQKMLNP